MQINVQQRFALFVELSKTFSKVSLRLLVCFLEMFIFKVLRFGVVFGISRHVENHNVQKSSVCITSRQNVSWLVIPTWRKNKTRNFSILRFRLDSFFFDPIHVTGLRDRGRTSREAAD